MLLPPYIYFRVVKYNLECNPQTMELEEIPFPRTASKKVIFWVDDMPDNNRGLIDNYFTPQGIEVIQIISTKIMKIILRDFFALLQALKK